MALPPVLDVDVEPQAAHIYFLIHPILEHETVHAEYDAMPFVELLRLHSRNLRAVGPSILVSNN